MLNPMDTTSAMDLDMDLDMATLVITIMDTLDITTLMGITHTTLNSSSRDLQMIKQAMRILQLVIPLSKGQQNLTDVDTLNTTPIIPTLHFLLHILFDIRLTSVVLKIN